MRPAVHVSLGVADTFRLTGSDGRCREIDKVIENHDEVPGKGLAACGLR